MIASGAERVGHLAQLSPQPGPVIALPTFRLAWALNRQAIAQTVYGGNATVGNDVATSPATECSRRA